VEFNIQTFNRFSSRHTALVETWWKERTGVSIDMDCLSDHGFMIYSNEDAIAAVFLYPVIGSGSAMIGYPISDCFIEKEIRQKALEALVGNVESTAKKMGYRYLVSYSGSKGSNSLFDRVGYERGDQNVINFIKKLV
jgi:hypothetical protein